MAGRTRGPASRPSGGPRPAQRRTAPAGRPTSRLRASSDPSATKGRADPPKETSRIGRSRAGEASGREASTEQQARGRPSFTGRAALLALVVGVLVVSYAYPLRTWYDQHAERNALEAEAAQLRESVDQLETELRLWENPAYVRAQARERLGYVLPGEVGYIVADESGVPEPEPGPDGLPVVPDGPWYSQLWASLRAADAEPPEGVEEPVGPGQQENGPGDGG